MEYKFLCVMASYDKETEDYLAKLQELLYQQGYDGTHTKNLPQHITLGTFSVEREEEVIQLLKNTANVTAQFSITFNYIGVFGGGNVLFVAPDTNKELLSLKEVFGDSENWTPHTTMLINEPNVIYTALPIVVENFKAFRGKVTTIHLYEFWPTRHIVSFDMGEK